MIDELTYLLTQYGNACVDFVVLAKEDNYHKQQALKAKLVAMYQAFHDKQESIPFHTKQP